MGPGPPWSPGRHQNQCSVQYVRHPIRRPSGSQLEAFPGSEPLVGWGCVTSVPARASLAASYCITGPRFAGGGGGGCPLLSWRPGLLTLTPAGVAWASSLRRSPPPPPRCAQPCRPRLARRRGRSTALLRKGAGMPDVPPGATVPNPPSHRSACGALSMFVCRANPKAWQSGVLLRVSGFGAALWRQQKRCPCIWYRAVLWFHHLVLRVSTGPLRCDGARVEITGIHPGRLLGSAFPRAPLPLTQAVAGRCCHFPLRSSLFVLPPHHSLPLLARPALRVVLAQSLQVMP